jgi:hypothetical protein
VLWPADGRPPRPWPAGPRAAAQAGAAALTMIDKKQDKALIERTLKKHHLARQGGGVDGGLGGDDGRQLRRAWPR